MSGMIDEAGPISDKLVGQRVQSGRHGGRIAPSEVVDQRFAVELASALAELVGERPAGLSPTGKPRPECASAQPKENPARSSITRCRVPGPRMLADSNSNLADRAGTVRIPLSATQRESD